MVRFSMLCAITNELLCSIFNMTDQRYTRSLLLDCESFGDAQFIEHYDRDELIEVYSHKLMDMECLKTRSGGVYFFNEASWDTAYFGFPVVRIHEWLGPANQDFSTSLRELQAHLCKRGTHLVLFRLGTSRTPMVHALTRVGYLLCGTKVMLSRYSVVEDKNYSNLAQEISAFEEDYSDQVLNLISSAIDNNHFALDPRIGSERASGIYRAWAQKLLRDDHAIRLIYRTGAEVLGFLAITVGKPYGVPKLAQFGFLDLIARKKGKPQRGIGRALLWEGTRQLAERQVSFFYANTMLTNISALRLFSSAGFQIHNAIHEWHGWIA